MQRGRVSYTDDLLVVITELIESPSGTALASSHRVLLNREK